MEELRAGFTPLPSLAPPLLPGEKPSPFHISSPPRCTHRLSNQASELEAGRAQLQGMEQLAQQLQQQVGVCRVWIRQSVDSVDCSVEGLRRAGSSRGWR